MSHSRDEKYKVGETIFVMLSDVCQGNVIIKEVAPNIVNLFTKPTKKAPKSEIFLKGMPDIKIQHSRTINKTTLWRHIKEWWGDSKMPFFDWIYIWRA